MPIQRLSHIGICVSDLERSLRFYRDGLGLALRSQIEMAGEPAATLLQLPDVHLRAVYLERDGTRIELLEYPSPGCTAAERTPRPMNQLGLTHLSLRVDDLDATLAELANVGVQIVRPSRIDIPGIAAAVFVTDPDGTLIELVQQPGD